VAKSTTGAAPPSLSSSRPRASCAIGAALRSPTRSASPSSALSAAISRFRGPPESGATGREPEPTGAIGCDGPSDSPKSSAKTRLRFPAPPLKTGSNLGYGRFHVPRGCSRSRGRGTCWRGSSCLRVALASRGSCGLRLPVTSAVANRLTGQCTASKVANRLPGPRRHTRVAPGETTTHAPSRRTQATPRAWSRSEVLARARVDTLPDADEGQARGRTAFPRDRG
jgi:hypothetical protein